MKRGVCVCVCVLIDEYQVAAACVQVEACVGITIWDLFYDPFSWVAPPHSRAKARHCFGTRTSPKHPAYDGIIEVFKNMANTARGGTGDGAGKRQGVINLNTRESI
jgi:hypothetical protein